MIQDLIFQQAEELTKLTGADVRVSIINKDNEREFKYESAPAQKGQCVHNLFVYKMWQLQSRLQTVELITVQLILQQDHPKVFPGISPYFISLSHKALQIH